MNENGYLSRLEQLTDDNAFISVHDVMDHNRVRNFSTTPSRDSTYSFLNLEETQQKTSRSGVTDLGVRVNITAALAEQHAKYFSWLEEHKRKGKPSSSLKRDQFNDHLKKFRKSKVDDMKSPSNLLTEDGCRLELQREKEVLEAWKYAMIHGNHRETKGSPSSSFQNFIEVHTTCPSFEAMTAPSVRRPSKYQYFLPAKKRKGFLPGTRKFVPLGILRHKVCSICLLPAEYKCVRCRRAFFCSIECHRAHEATRCLKFTV